MTKRGVLLVAKPQSKHSEDPDLSGLCNDLIGSKAGALLPGEKTFSCHSRPDRESKHRMNPGFPLEFIPANPGAGITSLHNFLAFTQPLPLGYIETRPFPRRRVRTRENIKISSHIYKYPYISI